MKKRNLINFVATGVLFILFIIFTIALLYIDVKPIGPNGSSVAFSAINKVVSEQLGVNMILYNITDLLSVIAILIAFGFTILGLAQFIRRKSLKRVDHSIIILGGFYLLVMAAYVFFEFNIINYRPVLIDNILEASYPSSTTMLIMCVMPTAIMQFNRLIKNRNAKIIVNTISVVFTILIVVGRVLSGVHWFTDILGGILLSASLVVLYYSVDKYFQLKQQ